MAKDTGSSIATLLAVLFSLLIFCSPFGLSNALGESRQIPVLKVTASSDGTESKDWPHHPEMAVDGNTYTCWASSANDQIGSWLEFFFKERVTVSSMGIVNGWIPLNYPDFFPQNHRVKQMTVVSDNGASETFVLEDTNKIQKILLKTKRMTKTLKIKIDAIYKSEQSKNPWVTISEIFFYE